MDPVTIASIVSGASSLVSLAAKLIAASKEEAAAILADMRAEVDKMTETLADGGSMDRSIAASDAKLDKAIEEAERPEAPNPTVLSSEEPTNP